MAKKKNAASRSRKQTTPRPTKSEIPAKFDGLTFYFSERIRHRDYSMVEFPDIARELGGEVSGKLTGNVDYLVVHQVKPSAKNEKQAEKLNKMALQSGRSHLRPSSKCTFRIPKKF